MLEMRNLFLIWLLAVWLLSFSYLVCYHHYETSLSTPPLRLRTPSPVYLRPRQVQLHSKLPKNPVLKLYPSDPVKFDNLLAASGGVVLGCHETWLGIREMTTKFSHYMGLPIIVVRDDSLGKRNRQAFYSVLLSLNVTALHFQGIPTRSLEFLSWVRGDGSKLMKNFPDSANMFASVAYHSGVGVHNVSPGESRLVEEAMREAAAGNLELVFIEPDQTAFARRLGIPACTLWPTFNPKLGIVPSETFVTKKTDEGRLKIGLLGTATRLAVKNFFTQFSAACMFDDADIFVNQLKLSSDVTVPQEFCLGTIEETGMLTSADFTAALGEFDVNLHVSWTDAVPNAILNSLAHGVPIITSDTSSIFVDSEFLKDLLVEPRIDDPNSIYERAKRAVAFVNENRTVFLSEVDKLFTALDAKAVESWSCFLQSTHGESMCLNERNECVANIPLRKAARTLPNSKKYY